MLNHQLLYASLLPMLQQVRFSVEIVTVEMARQWLANDNVGNRRLRMRHAEFLGDLIHAGRWRPIPWGLAFDPKGNLLDGQHRLQAIIIAGVPLPMVIARNVPAEAYEAMDRGAMRSIADVLRQDRAATILATTLCRNLLTNHMTPSPPDVEMVLEAFAAEISQVMQLRVSKPFRLVSLRIGLMLRLADAVPGQGDMLIRQWQAIQDTDAEMDPLSQAFLRRLLNDRVPGSNSAYYLSRLIVLSWQAFDPNHRDRENHRFRLDLSAYQEMQTAAARIIASRKTVREDGSRLEQMITKLLAA